MTPRSILVLCTLLATLAMGRTAAAERTLEEYRYFRALSIDLSGRIPTRDEVAAFERDDFDLDAWLDARLQGPAYAERLRRIYMDLLRLQVSNAFVFRPTSNMLRRVQVKDPDGNLTWVYWRTGQRRRREETDGAFCLTPAETGVQLPANNVPAEACNNPRPVARDLWDRHTVTVRPWWLYRDYRAARPTQRYGPEWASRHPDFVPVDDLLTEPDGSPVTAIRICREEAQTDETGVIFAPGHTRPAGTGCNARLAPMPGDTAYARAHAGERVSCTSEIGYRSSPDCGCGVGLERCLPGLNNRVQSAAFMLPNNFPLADDAPLDVTPASQPVWWRHWWTQEAVHFLDHVFAEDRDFREVLTARYTFVNGPLAQFYRTTAPMRCCGEGVAFNYTQPVSLFDPDAVPTTLLPHDVRDWTRVASRGPRASGLLTMPVFLTKYATRRARAHALYNAFLCREFVAEDVELRPSTNPNLMERPGCAACHATLEPLSAYFTRIQEGGWNFLPAARFPLDNPECATADPANMSRACRTFYDPDFTTARRSLLRGAYASMANAEAGPAGIAAQITGSSRFAPCVASNVAESFLGRPLHAEDGALRSALTEAFTSGNFRMRSLVRAMVLSEAYRHANNLTPTAWRERGER